MGESVRRPSGRACVDLEQLAEESTPIPSCNRPQFRHCSDTRPTVGDPRNEIVSFPSRFAICVSDARVCRMQRSHAGPGAADSTEVTASQMIDAFEGTFGVHPGQRRNHIKGTCAAGEFVGTTDAAALSRSALFSGKTIPVVGAFLTRGRQSRSTRRGAGPRGMALEFRLPGSALQHITMINVPIFAAASPASFREAFVAAKPDPKTGKPDPEKLKAYAATHPDAMALSSSCEPAILRRRTTIRPRTSAFTRSSSSMRKAPSTWCGGASSRAMARKR